MSDDKKNMLENKKAEYEYNVLPRLDSSDNEFESGARSPACTPTRVGCNAAIVLAGGGVGAALCAVIQLGTEAAVPGVAYFFATLIGASLAAAAAAAAQRAMCFTEEQISHFNDVSRTNSMTNFGSNKGY